MGNSAASELFLQRQQQALAAMGWYEQLKARANEVGRRSNDAIRARALELARAYLAELSPAALVQVERLTGFVGFKRQDPIKALEHERQVLTHTAERIEADERYVQREVLAGPDGTLRAKTAQAEELMGPFSAECTRFEELEGFGELIALGYDTPAYGLSWLQKEYWRHWAAGDRICETLSLGDFGDDVRPAYEKATQQRDFWRAEIASLAEQLRQIHALVHEHDDARARSQSLEPRYLEQCHGMLAQHLAAADVALLDDWLDKELAGKEEDRGVRMALRNLSGLRAKCDVMRELLDNGIEPVLAELQARHDKYQRKVEKFNRPKHWGYQVPATELDAGFDEKLQKLQHDHGKLSLLIDRIGAYDDYDRFNLDNDPDLWWHAFSGGKPPPRALPRLRDYYQRHPDATPRYDDGPDTAAAVALAAAEAASTRHDPGYLS